MKAKINHVEGWKTSDGQVFEDLREAEGHQSYLDFREWCSENICCGGEWTSDMVAREVWRHWYIARRTGLDGKPRPLP